jgi:hypothetical protein
MSYTLNMTVFNQSGQVLTAYSAAHEWDGNKNAITDKNLGMNESSSGVTITSGHEEHDNYVISWTTADGNKQSTSFWCDASADNTAVQIQINSNDCNCVYYVNSGVDSGCYAKG